jgi:hypothetical protein
MKTTLLILVLTGVGSFGVSQQISCAHFDEQQGFEPPQYTMRGCRSFNELLAAGGIKITQGPGIKSYACFGTTFPEEGHDLFILASLGGVMSFSGDNKQNGMASMQTFGGGVKLNGGFTDMTWTQYPEERPILWSEGTWVGHGDAQMTGWNEEAKSLVEQPAAIWKSLHIPRLHASVESDTVTLRLELNNASGAVETLDFNRRTGRALLDLGSDERAVRCVSVEEPN